MPARVRLGQMIAARVALRSGESCDAAGGDFCDDGQGLLRWRAGTLAIIPGTLAGG
jgi:hypothetical protein